MGIVVDNDDENDDENDDTVVAVAVVGIDLICLIRTKHASLDADT